MTIAKLVTRIDRTREQGNLSSAIRLFGLHHDSTVSLRYRVHRLVDNQQGRSRGITYSFLCLDRAADYRECEVLLACETHTAGLDFVGAGEAINDRLLLLG